MSAVRHSADLPTVERSAVTPALQERDDSAASRAGQRAWLILWLAFATFCALVASSVKVGYDFVTTADIQRTARAEQIKGQVYAQVPNGPKVVLDAAGYELTTGTVLETLRGANARIRTFEDSAVTLMSESQVELLRMDVGRFINRRTLIFRQSTGPARYQTSGETEVHVPNGGTVKLTPRSDITVWVQENVTRVLVYEGEARVEVDGQAQSASAGQRVELGANRRLAFFPTRAVQLLANGDFSKQAEGWTTIDYPIVPLDVDGERWFVPSPNGASKPALRIVRDSQTNQHSETGLQQLLDVDVSGFRSLTIEALVRVDRQSLSGGGNLGSEYPMMLRLQYEGIGPGSRPDWTRGFYIENPEQKPVRNAEQVTQGEWKRYSVNLFEQDEDRIPYRLLAFEVMGQGHTYDARVADIRLLGD